MLIVRYGDKMIMMMIAAQDQWSTSYWEILICSYWKDDRNQVFLHINHFNYGQVHFIKILPLTNLMNFEEGDHLKWITIARKWRVSMEQQANVLQKQGPMFSAFGNLCYQLTVKGPVDVQIVIDLLLGTSVQSF